MGGTCWPHAVGAVGHEPVDAVGLAGSVGREDLVCRLRAAGEDVGEALGDLSSAFVVETVSEAEGCGGAVKREGEERDENECW